MLEFPPWVFFPFSYWWSLQGYRLQLATTHTTCIYTQPSTGELSSSNLSKTHPSLKVIRGGTCITLKLISFHQFTNPCLYVRIPALLLYDHGWTDYQTACE